MKTVHSTLVNLMLCFSRRSIKSVSAKAAPGVKTPPLVWDRKDKSCVTIYQARVGLENRKWCLTLVASYYSHSRQCKQTAPCKWEWSHIQVLKEADWRIEQTDLRKSHQGVRTLVLWSYLVQWQKWSASCLGVPCAAHPDSPVYSHNHWQPLSWRRNIQRSEWTRELRSVSKGNLHT